jgi:hypothetical protein
MYFVPSEIINKIFSNNRHILARAVFMFLSSRDYDSMKISETQSYVVDVRSNVFDRYFINDRYFSSLIYLFISSSSATTTATSSLIYYVMCLRARFYDYLASSDVKIK